MKIKFYKTIVIVLLACLTWPTMVNAKEKPITAQTYNQEKLFLETPYNKRLFDLSYKIYLANGNTLSAFNIAYSAVRQLPTNIVWRERLAKVGVWAGKHEVVYQQLLYLLQVKPSDELYKKLTTSLKTSKDANIYVKRLQNTLKRNPNNPTAWQALIAMHEQIGQPKLTLKTLQHAQPYVDPKLYYSTSAEVYFNLGELSAVKKALQSLEHHGGLTPKQLTMLMSIYQNQGQIKQAYQHLLKNKKTLKTDDATYWQNLASFAWLLQHKDMARNAYLKVIRLNKATSDDYSRAITLTQDSHPDQAFKLAKQSWQKYPNSTSALAVISTASTLKQWHYLQGFFKHIPTPVKKQLHANLSYWTSQGNMWFELGNRHKAEYFYQRAFNQFPDNINLKVDYLWLLVNMKDKVRTAKQLQGTASILKQTPALWAPTAAGLLLLGNYSQALTIFQWQLNTKFDDYRWLIDLADTLDALGMKNQAHLVKLQAWHYLQKDLRQHQHPLDNEMLYAYLVLAPYGGHIDSIMTDFKYLLAQAPNQRVYDKALNYAIEQQYFELADYLANSYKNSKLHVPPNIKIALAIHNYDTDEMASVINQHDDVLADTEKFGALELMGEKSRAASMAYHALEKNPRDSALYDDAADNMLQQANHWLFVPEYTQHGSLEGPKTIMKLHQHLTPRWIIMPFVNRWRYRTTDTAIFSNPPKKDTEGGFGLRYLTSRGYYEMNVSDRDSLTNFTTGNFKTNYQFTQRLNSMFLIGYNQRADETNGLRIAGMKDTIEGKLEYQLSARDILEGHIKHKRFFDQTRVYLGQGQDYWGSVTHRFFLAYPDPSITGFMAVHRYHAQGIPSNKLLSIFPGGTVPAPDLLMPIDFVQYGLFGQVGSAYIENYTRSLKPFAEGSIFFDTNTGVGYFANIGFGSSIFGRDHLALQLTYSKNTKGTEQEDKRVGLRYKYFYS